jgi:hypothetical protein
MLMHLHMGAIKWRVKPDICTSPEVWKNIEFEDVNKMYEILKMKLKYLFLNVFYSECSKTSI